MVDYFRDLATNNKRAKKIGAFDPYHKFYTLHIEDEPEFIQDVNCGNSFFKILRADDQNPFVYSFVLNNLTGTADIQYVVVGTVTITVNYNSTTDVYSGVTGTGSIEIERENVSDFQTVTVTIVATSEVAELSLTHVCPLGLPFKLFEIVLADQLDNGQNITNRFKWSTSPYYDEVVTLSNPLTKFEEFNGVEGQGKFPMRNTNLFIES